MIFLIHIMEWLCTVITNFYIRKCFEPRSNITWLKKIIWVIGVLRKDCCITAVLLRTPVTQMIFFNQTSTSCIYGNMVWSNDCPLPSKNNVYLFSFVKLSLLSLLNILYRSSVSCYRTCWNRYVISSFQGKHHT